MQLIFGNRCCSCAACQAHSEKCELLYPQTNLMRRKQILKVRILEARALLAYVSKVIHIGREH